MSNAVIYARYSSGHQREESIEGQIRECTNFAKRNGLTIVEHYIDRAISAKTDDRPSFQQKSSLLSALLILQAWLVCYTVTASYFAADSLASAALVEDIAPVVAVGWETY